MCSDMKILKAVVLAVPCLLMSCSSLRVYQDLGTAAGLPALLLPDDREGQEEDADTAAERVDSVRTQDGPLIMNAIRDSKTGEMIATDVIKASRVVARFRNIAERAGRISLTFDVSVPKALVTSDCQLRFYPQIEAGDISARLDPLFITGQAYRKRQLRGYERYRMFLESIIQDSTVFIRQDQLEKFIERYFPETFAMKNDTSVVPDPEAENLFGVDQRAALAHYTKHGLKRRNRWKMENKDSMFRKFVRSPFDGSVSLDTVMTAGDGSLVYRYTHEMASAPGLRKLYVSLDGVVYRDGEKVAGMPSPERLTFYVSSLSSLADNTPRYLFRIVDRVVTDNTDAFLDFGQGSHVLDSLHEGNAAELGRIRRCFNDIYSRHDLILDSIVVTASCSPEGRVGYNGRLAEARSRSVREYILAGNSQLEDSLVRTRHIPENWEYFCRLVSNDTVLSLDSRKRILEIAAWEDKDRSESRLSGMPEYRYLREKIYPRLRTVNFRFFMHRPDVEKDTIHTKVLDTVYMAGLEALRNLDYKKAATILAAYGDYNAALALASSGYDGPALEILSSMPAPDAKAYYLAAVLYSRAGEHDRALDCFSASVEKDPSMAHRANLDPELSPVAVKYHSVYGMMP